MNTVLPLPPLLKIILPPLVKIILKLSSYQCLGNPSRLFPCRPAHQNVVWISLLHYACHIPCPSHPPLFNHPNNIWYQVQTRNLCTVPFSPMCYQFLLLKPNIFLSNPNFACVLSVITETNNATADNCQSQLQPILARTHHRQVTESTTNTYKDSCNLKWFESKWHF